MRDRERKRKGKYRQNTLQTGSRIEELKTGRKKVKEIKKEIIKVKTNAKNESGHD